MRGGLSWGALQLLGGHGSHGWALQAGEAGTAQAAQQSSAAPGPQPCVAGSRVSYPPLLERFIDKLDPANDIFPSEVYVAEISRVLDRWSQSLRAQASSPEALLQSLSANLTGTSLTPLASTALRSSGPLRIERCSYAETTVGTNAFLAGLTAWLAAFSSIEAAEFEIFNVRVAGESPLRVETDMRYNLVGTSEARVREQRTGIWQLSWVRSEAPQAQQTQPAAGSASLVAGWTVHSWTAGPEMRSRLTGSGFSDITAQCLAQGTPGMAQLSPGIDDWRGIIDGASGIDVYGNHGVAVGDIDGSGFDSFYVCQPSGLPNRLYRNRGDGTFDDVTEHSGTGILDGTASALFVDFLNRGQQDLLVVRSGGPLLFINQGDGRFEPRPEAFHFARPAQGTFTSASVADYNRDGLLDIYFCVYSYYQGLSQYSYPSPFYDAQNGPPNFLFRNRGDGTFEDVTATSGMDRNNNRFSFAAAWCDYDGNGYPDLYVANDFGRKNLYRNNGDGTFTDIAQEAGVQDYGPGMSACWLDYDNDGLQDVYVANMWLAEGKRITADEHFLPGVDPAVRAIYRKHNAGNSLYRNTGNGHFADETNQGGTTMGGWSWSSDSWDFDHDGFPDIYVANGFVSGADHYDLQGFFWRQVVQCSAGVAQGSPDYELSWNAVNELVRSDYSWAGYQRNVLFVNNHDGTFANAAGVLGLDLRDDSRAYALSDFDHDGRLEFVLKNRTGPQLRVLRNNMEGIGASIAFRLTGHRSNRDAIGTAITIESGAARQTKFLAAGSGFASQHTKELFFGLGPATGTVSISVRWPTGKVQRFDTVPVNHRIAIEEEQPGFHAAPFVDGAPASPAQAAQRQAQTAHRDPGPVRNKTWLIDPLFGPDLDLPDLDNKSHRLSALKGSPVLLSFFRLDCGGSRSQIEQLQQQAAKFAAAGIAIRAVALGPGAGQAAVQAFATSSRLSFPILLADDRAAIAWNIQYRYLFDRRRNIAAPTTFLLDASGAIICVYHGYTDPTAILADWKTAPETPQQRFARAMPFPGLYYGNPIKRDYFTYGVAFIEYGYADEAQAAFQRVVDANPGYANAWFNLGTIYLNKKQYAEARRCLQQTLRISPTDADAWNNLGLISGEEGKYDEALDEFLHSARANPNYELAVQNMTRIYQFQKRPADAQRSMEELVALAPQNSNLRMGLAMTMVAQGDVSRAVEQLQTAIRLKPDNTEALNNLGAVYMRMGRDHDALNQFEQCRKLAPDFDRPYINIALIYKNSGEPGKASQILEAFLARHPDSTDVRSVLQQLGAR